jgi:superfamily II DNA or RNA helicase
MIKVTPWESQVRASESMLRMNRKIIGMDGGGGKTLAALMTIDAYNKSGKHLNVVLCPKSALTAWIPDIEEFTDFKYSVNDLRKDVDINLYTFSNVQELFHKTIGLTKEHRSVIVVDEAHALASATSDRAACLRGKSYWDFEGMEHVSGILDRFKYAYGLTATIMINHIEDVYYMINSFFKGFFPSLDEFMNTYAIQELRQGTRFNPIRKITEKFWYKEVVGVQNLDQLSKILEPLIFRHSIDYKQNIFVNKIELTEEEKNAYYQVARGILGKRKGSFVARLPALQEITNGSVTEDLKFKHGILLSTKERELVELLNKISSKGEGALVFTQFKKSTFKRFSVMQQYLKFDHFHFLSGDSNDKERKRIVMRLAPKDVLFATRAGGTSMNFQAVNNVIFFDLPWSVGEFLQNMGRITRSNTTYSELNVHLILAKDTIDEYKYALIQSNLAIQKDLFGGFNFADIYFSKIRRQSVIELRKDLLHGIRMRGGKKVMPVIKCANCRRFTNSALSTWEFVGEDMTATACYAAWDERTKQWVKGCGFDQASEFDKNFALKYIGTDGKSK